MDDTWIRHWQPVIKVFDPIEKFHLAGDPGHFHVSRPDSPLNQLEMSLRLSPDAPRAITLTGHRGSGKTSELVQLTQRLNERMTIIWMDAGKRLDYRDFGHVELFLMLAATVHDYWPVPKEFEGFANRLATVTREKLGEASATMVLDHVKTLGAEGRITLFNRTTRETLEVPLVLGSLVDGLNRLLKAAAVKAGGKPLLLIVDGTQNLDLETARPIFVNNSLLADLHCHLIMTIPFALYASAAQSESRQQGIEPFFVPNVKLHEQGQAELNPDGLALMEEIVARRLAHANAPDRLEPAALRRFVEMSGGVIRELIYLVNKACVQATIERSPQITLPIAETVVAQYRLDKAWGLPYDYFYEELVKVHQAGALTDRRAKDEQGQEFVICDRLLHSLYLLGYRNGGPWFDVHPLVWPLVESYLKRTDRGLLTP